MTEHSRIGVALCTYNGARFVEEQLVSVLSQAPAPAQLVVADDGSSDDTLSIVHAVAEGWGTPVRLLEGEAAPLGVTANFERAVRAIDTPVIALSDQDDRWHSGRLAELGERFSDDALTLLHTDADLVDADGHPLGRTLFASLEIQPAELAAEESGHAFDALLRRNLATGATIVFRRSLLEHALPFPPSWVHDEWLAILAAAIGRVDVVRTATIDYRQHGSNEIGVAEPTLARKIGRVLEPRGDRNRRLAARFAELGDRLELLGGLVPPARLAAAREKARFEARRADFPANRLRRLSAVLRLAATGDYARYASRGSADVLRDLLQPV